LTEPHSALNTGDAAERYDVMFYGEPIND